jgi:hypothetical protein
MAEKKPKAKKLANYAKLGQKQKFIAAAKASDADESGTTFRQVLTQLISKSRKYAQK